MVCREHGRSLKLWSFVAPHGSLELPAVVIGGAAGFRLASGLLFSACGADDTPSRLPGPRRRV